MKNNLNGMPFQLDFKTNHTPDGAILDYIQENSTRVQHLLDSEPRISRWWFQNLSQASKAILMLEEDNVDIDYRLVASDIDAIFIQKGEF